MVPALTHLLSADPRRRPLDGVDAWWARHHEVAELYERPIDRALVAGFAADRLGFAFASGYEEALVALCPQLRHQKTALCATEASPGAHPSTMHTRLEADGAAYALSGDKSFVTLGDQADTLLVVANEGKDDEGRMRLVVVRVPADRAGVELEVLPPTSFVPEVPHARVHLSNVAVAAAERLPGDGYADYLKPFRTIEDIHVFASMLGYLLGVGRRSEWPKAQLAELLHLASALRSLALAPPLDPTLHVALAGLQGATARALSGLEEAWQSSDAEERALWQRDQKLLRIAGAARARRFEAAWGRVRATSPPPEHRSV